MMLCQRFPLSRNVTFCCCSLKEATDLIAGLLGGQVRLFTTQCAMHELKTLGKDYAGVLKLPCIT